MGARISAPRPAGKRMIWKSAKRLSEKIMRNQDSKAR
jgi:hypothetical protein